MKKRKFILATLLFLIVFMTGIIMNEYYFRTGEITDAFAASESACLESRLQMTADYGSAFLIEHDKTALIAFLANELGIVMDTEVERSENEECEVYKYVKNAARATTTIMTVTRKEEVDRTYLYAEVVLKNDDRYDILEVRDCLNEAFTKLKVERVETTLQLQGGYDGRLDISEWKKISNSLMKRLRAEICYENRDAEMYTLYGYSHELPEYVSVVGEKINVQVAIKYDEVSDKTVVYLASPLIRGDW